MLVASTARRTGLVLATILFVFSLAFNTFLPAEGEPSFLLGIICLLFGFGYAAWYANPMLLISAVLLRFNKTRLALLTSALALSLGSSALLIDKVPYNEAGDDAEVIGYGLGFLMWLGSMLVVLLVSLWCSITSWRAGSTSQTRGDSPGSSGDAR